jgi:biotin transport system substrate-specific component
MLVGSILGARRGLVTMLVFLALVAVGLPLLAGGIGGLGVFGSPRVGFLIGFPVAAYVVGLLTERGGPAYTVRRGIVANVVGGIGVLYVFGIAGIMAVGRVGIDAAATSVTVFLPGDALKAVVAALVASGVHAGYPGLLSSRGDARQTTPV